MTIAIDSVSTVSPSTSTGSFPAGLIFRNSGWRCSPATRLAVTASNSTPSSCSVHRALIERVGANSYSFIDVLLESGSGCVTDPGLTRRRLLRTRRAASPVGQVEIRSIFIASFRRDVQEHVCAKSTLVAAAVGRVSMEHSTTLVLDEH